MAKDQTTTEMSDESTSPSNESTESSSAETRPAEGSITYDTLLETVDTVVGRIIKLGPNAAVWRSESKAIELSLFTGNITAVITAEVPVIDREQIISGLRAGTIVYALTEEKVKPSTLMYDDSTDAMKARMFLDNPNADAFKKELATIKSREFLEKCIRVYEAEYRTTPRLQMLKAHLEQIS